MVSAALGAGGVAATLHYWRAEFVERRRMRVGVEGVARFVSIVRVRGINV